MGELSHQWSTQLYGINTEILTTIIGNVLVIGYHIIGGRGKADELMHEVGRSLMEIGLQIGGELITLYINSVQVKKETQTQP